MQKVTQEQQVIEVLRNAGGYATLRRLNELVDFSTWATKTPEALPVVALRPDFPSPYAKANGIGAEYLIYV